MPVGDSQKTLSWCVIVVYDNWNIFIIAIRLWRRFDALCCLLQDDKDLVHAFVNNDGLECLITIGTEADQNYQNYILRGEEKLYISRFTHAFS